MKLFRKAAVAAAVIAGALAFAPAAAQAHSASSGSTYTPRVASCSLGSQHYTGNQVGLVNLGNLNLSVLDNTAIGALGGVAGATSSRSISCLAN